jgi:sigma-B regulation protein RsbU (phosphoserine phosphatase)
MSLARPSLAWKIATANILLALFAVFLAGMLQYRKERRILAATMRQELTQVVASGALLIGGEKAEALAQSRAPSVTAPITQVFQSLLIASPEVDRIYVLGAGPDGDPHFLLGQGVGTDTNPGSILSAHAQECFERGAPVTTDVYEDADVDWFSAFHPLRDRQGRVVAVLGADQRASDLQEEARERLKSILLSGFAAAALAVLLSLFLARSVTRPLNLMAESTAEIAAGNLGIRLNIHSHDEVGKLAASFNQMVNRLSVAADDRARLQQELLEKQKMDQELSLAAEIQRSFQPFAFPCSSWFCTCARTMPAEVVGGDFFDFIDLGDQRQGIAIGDVAGRGIAASIYLARLISDFRAAAARTSSPREALERLNQQLMMRATRGLFVTMTYMVLEAETGQLCYATGGHLPMLRRSGATQEVEILYGDQGLPLGIENDALLVDRKIQLAPGDTLLLVTDGVVEALGPDRTEFKMERLAQIFREEASGASQLVEDMFERIGTITPGPPEDDLTVLAVTWTPQRGGVPR